MIAIHKGVEPEDLAHLRQVAVEKQLTAKQAYETLRGRLKETVRNSLIEEQGALCAYCMCKIPRIDVDPRVAPIVIEHLTPRSLAGCENPEHGLDYNNLLAVCNGNKVLKGHHKFKDLTCDAHKGNTELSKVNPCKPETLDSIYYELDGKISAQDLDVKNDLVEVLNLNCPTSTLVAERKAVLDELIGELGNVTASDESQLFEYCVKILKGFQAETREKTPFVGILIWYLQDLIKALTPTSDKSL